MPLFEGIFCMKMQHAAATGFLEALRASGDAASAPLKRMETVAWLLDTAFVIPGTRQRVGIDAIIGLIPGFGDIATTLLSSYVIWEARNLGLSRFAIGRMLANLAIHASIG